MAEIKTPSDERLARFHKQFGDVGAALADALPVFSLDICGVVAGYCSYATDTLHAKPKSLLMIDGQSDKSAESFEDAIYGLGVSPDGSKIFVGDRGHLKVFDSEGKFIKQILHDQFQNWVTAISVGPNNVVYIADYYKHRFVMCDLDGQYLGSFGKQGSEPGQFHHAWGITAHTDGLLYVADSFNQRVQVLKQDGSFVRQFGKAGGSGPGKFAYPRHVVLNEAGTMWVSDANNHRVQVFDNSGKFLRQFGTQGSKPGQFQRAWGLAMDSVGNIFVSEWDNGRVQIFHHKDESLLTTIDTFTPERPKAATGKDTKSVDALYRFSSSVKAVCIDCKRRIIVGDSSRRVFIFGFESC